MSSEVGRRRAAGSTPVSTSSSGYGDAAARAQVEFAAFVREHVPALTRTAYLLTGSALGAEELVQDTLVRLYPKWDRVAAADVPLAYVRRSLSNAYVNDRRRASRREYAYAEVPESVDEYDAIGRLADRDQLRDVLAGLPDRQRAALVLRFFEDLDDADTADALGCRVGTVRSLISRGLATLRDRLDPPTAGRTS
ncbi:RNA polymerase sigma-70 factor, sigma-E family [Jatrophihabitans endophyticus]|uniref:RNA polymerase sigma-70 factor, sigma-E family n=1 Tax=Jatrophihabitans endophyticus TaxID=1206085 RepID=A0A1M5GG82_9ACTN|nr:SigE family RNA polymerase sigma factor [Jatrophihabitans endophyticus]SHG02727.1 RNA polymerase sigma-70 factor, sigma-E family [Jatrophihabitans endophyticus]